MNRSRWHAALFVLAFATGPIPAGADPAEADTLFRDGRALMKDGNYRAACPKFAASQRLDPAAGTSINLGDCLVQLGKLADALAAYEQARGLLKDGDPRLAPLEAQIRALKPRVPRIVLRAGEKLGGDAQVKCSGEVIERSRFGEELRVNPGKQVVLVSAPGRDVARFEVVLAEGDRRELVVEAAPESAPASRRPNGRIGRLDAQARDASSNTLGYVLAGFAVVGAAGFVGFGLAGNAKKNTLDDCKPNCEDHTLFDNMKRDYLLANISLGVAVVGGAASIYTFVQAPGVQSSRGIQIGGRW